MHVIIGVLCPNMETNCNFQILMAPTCNAELHAPSLLRRSCACPYICMYMYVLVLLSYIVQIPTCTLIYSVCRCGLSGCLKKCLSVLPYIGDDEDENSDADFEVRTCISLNRPVSRNVRNVINQRDVTAGVHCVEYVACEHIEKSGYRKRPAYRISF